MLKITTFASELQQKLGDKCRSDCLRFFLLRLRVLGIGDENFLHPSPIQKRLGPFSFIFDLGLENTFESKRYSATKSLTKRINITVKTHLWINDTVIFHNSRFFMVYQTNDNAIKTFVRNRILRNFKRLIFWRHVVRTTHDAITVHQETILCY